MPGSTGRSSNRSSLIACRTMTYAGGKSRIASSTTARDSVSADTASPMPAGVRSCAMASAARRSCQSGSRASRCKAQNSAMAVVS